MPNSIKIVLINTFHPGNIGSAARAMKVMGLKQLVLVNPQKKLSEEAYSLAAGAQDVLHNASCFSSVEEAIADCHWVIGTSARSRSLSWPQMDARHLGHFVKEHADTAQIAILFGPETMGLTNEQLQMCNYHLCIPGNSSYSVLNLSHAVQIVCYEIYVSLNSIDEPVPRNGHLIADIGSTDSDKWLNKDRGLNKDKWPTVTEMDRFFDHLELTLTSIGFVLKQHPGQALVKLKRLFVRAQMEKNELNMLRGLLSRIDECLQLGRQCPTLKADASNTVFQEALGQEALGQEAIVPKADLAKEVVPKAVEPDKE